MPAYHVDYTNAQVYVARSLPAQCVGRYPPTPVSPSLSLSLPLSLSLSGLRSTTINGSAIDCCAHTRAHMHMRVHAEGVAV